MAQHNCFSIRIRSLALTAVTLLVSASAIAQWQWIDPTGQKVFSDTAPPPGIPDKNILKRPGMRGDLVPAAATPDASQVEAAKGSGVETPPMPASSGTDKTLEAKKKQAEAAELAKRKAEAERFAKARADNCEQAKRAKNTYSSGVRIVTTNQKGEREFVDDAKRAAELKRIEGIIESDCGPMPVQ